MPETIQVTLPDGSKKELPRGATPYDVAKSISPRLADAALVAKIKPKPSAGAPKAEAAPPSSEEKGPASMHVQQSKDGWMFADLARPLEEDVELRLLTDKDPEALEVYRHSSAHLMATAVLELFPETKLGHGPPTDSGFFYDFYRPTPFTPEDLEKIERRMQEIVTRDEKFVRDYVPREEGLARFKAEGDFMKVHFIEQFTKPGDPISLYRNGKFVEFSPEALLTPQNGLHLDQVNDASKSIFGPDWQLNGKRMGPQAILNHSNDSEKVSSQPVHFIDKRDAGNSILICLAPNGFCLGLDAAYRTKNRDRPVKDPQRSFHLNRKIYMARSVNDVDSVIAPKAGRGC